MKIAEALVRMKDIKGKIAEVTAKISNDCRFRKIYPSQDVPSIEEDIYNLVALAEELSSFKTRVAKTNVKHGLVDKMNEMDHLKFMVNSFDSLAKAKQEEMSLEYLVLNDGRVTITTYATYNVIDMQEKVDDMKHRIRELDLELQRLNWQIDLEN